jgi:hypothetical protein
MPGQEPKLFCVRGRYARTKALSASFMEKTDGFEITIAMANIHSHPEIEKKDLTGG